MSAWSIGTHREEPEVTEIDEQTFCFLFLTNIYGAKGEELSKQT